MLTLISQGGARATLPRQFALISNLAKISLEADPSATELPLLSVKDSVLPKVVEYMQHHKGVAMPILAHPLRSSVMAEVCQDKWDATFIDAIADDRQMLYDVILTANYLDIKCLLHLGSAKVASLIKGKPLAMMRTILTRGKPATESSSVSSSSASSSQ